MASREAVRKALKLLAVNFAGEITTEKAKLWAVALADVPDEALGRAIPQVIRTYEGQFVPPVAVVRSAAGANLPVVVDAERVMDAIEAMGSYTPENGWSAPTIEAVRLGLGEATAVAYGLAGGGARLFSAHPTTREIAARDFQQALNQFPESIPETYRVGGTRYLAQLGAGEPA